MVPIIPENFRFNPLQVLLCFHPLYAFKKPFKLISNLRGLSEAVRIVRRPVFGLHFIRSLLKPGKGLSRGFFCDGFHFVLVWLGYRAAASSRMMGRSSNPGENREKKASQVSSWSFTP